MVTEQSKEKNMLYNTLYIQFRRKVAVIYSQSELSREKKNEKNIRLKSIANQNYRGTMTECSKKMLRKKVSVWFQAIEAYNRSEYAYANRTMIKPVFLTVTLSSTQRNSDKEVKSKILKPFLRILREEFRCENYIWKAEKQGNGNIHFHIIIDKYIDKSIIQSNWNNCQQHLGYIDDFQKKFDHRNPPSCKIEVIKDWNTMSSYLEKYVCKENSEFTIEGAIWKASKKLLTLNYFEQPVPGTFEIALEKEQAVENLKIIQKERYTVILPEKLSIDEIIMRYFANSYRAWRNSLIDFMYVQHTYESFPSYLFAEKQKERVRAQNQQIMKNVYVKKSEQLTLFQDKEIEKREEKTKNYKAKIPRFSGGLQGIEPERENREPLWYKFEQI